MRKLDFAYAKTKAQLISDFVFTARIVQSLFFLNPKSQAFSFFFCDCTGRLMSDLVGNPEDRFSRVAAHITMHFCEFVLLFQVKDINSSTTIPLL